jgi:hypothetical protein
MFGIKKLGATIRKMLPTFSTVMEMFGFVALVYGVGLFSIPVAFIVGGILLIVAGGLAA